MARGVVDEFVIPKSTGKSFIVKKGQVLRVIEHEGKQVASVAFFNAHNYKEQSSARHSVILESIEAMAGNLDRKAMKSLTHIYSKVPWENVMATVIDDKVGNHVAACFCTRKCYEIALNDPGHRSCGDNFSECLREYGISLEDLDSSCAYSVFMNEVIDRDLNLRIEPPASEKGDYIDFLAEMDLLVGISACPFPNQTNDYEPKAVKIQILE
jgi:uncharacterized protein YcgI (DUF1989 family)